VQNQRLGERPRPRVGERAEDERAGKDDDDRGRRAGADPPRRIDDLPAATADRADGRGDALDETARPPGDERRPGVVDGGDERLSGRRHDDRLAEVDEVVVGVAGARQPDAPVEHLELAAGVAERQHAAALEQCEVTATAPVMGRFVLRIHHRSPALTMAVMIASPPVKIQ